MATASFTNYKVFLIWLSLMIAAAAPARGQTPPISPANSLTRQDDASRADLQQALECLQPLDAPPRYRKALLLLKHSSDNGSSDATAWLGSLYLYGRGTDQNVRLAGQLIRSSAAQKSPVGLRFLGLLYSEGQGLPQDYSMAVKYFGEAASLGDAPSYGRLGMLYLSGSGITPDHGKAEELLKIGSQLGDPWSMVELGRLYATDGLPGHQVLALQQYRAGAARGNRLAAFRAGISFETGQGTSKDPLLAISYYTQAAKQWHAGAQLALCRFYHEGIGVEQDSVRALSYCSLASDQGLADASVYEALVRAPLTQVQITQSEHLKRTLRQIAFPATSTEAQQ